MYSNWKSRSLWQKGKFIKETWFLFDALSERSLFGSQNDFCWGILFERALEKLEPNLFWRAGWGHYYVPFHLKSAEKHNFFRIPYDANSKMLDCCHIFTLLFEFAFYKKWDGMSHKMHNVKKSQKTWIAGIFWWLLKICRVQATNCSLCMKFGNTKVHFASKYNCMLLL